MVGAEGLLAERTGERLGTVELPAVGSYGLITYMREGRQHIIVQVNSPDRTRS